MKTLSSKEPLELDSSSIKTPLVQIAVKQHEALENRNPLFIPSKEKIDKDRRRQSREDLGRIFVEHPKEAVPINESPADLRVQLETLSRVGYQSIYINTFEAFRNDPERLRLLQTFKERLDFLFLDLPQLKQSNLEGAIKVLEYQSQSRSAKIKETLYKKSEAGIQLGNPAIGDSRGKAIRKRKYNALLDPAMKSLRKEAKKLQDAGWSLNKIAQYFTEQGVKSPRGGSFHAKTIDRLLEQWKELETRWLKRARDFAGLNFTTGTLFLDGNSRDFDSENPTIPESEVPLNRENLNELIEDKLLLHFTEPLKFNVKVFIHDNSEEQEPLYSDIIEKGESSFGIDLAEQILLPGRHYLSLVAENEAYLPIKGLELQFYPSLIETEG